MRTALLMASLVAAVSFAACSKKEETTTSAGYAARRRATTTTPPASTSTTTIVTPPAASDAGAVAPPTAPRCRLRLRLGRRLGCSAAAGSWRFGRRADRSSRLARKAAFGRLFVLKRRRCARGGRPARLANDLGQPGSPSRVSSTLSAPLCGLSRHRLSRRRSSRSPLRVGDDDVAPVRAPRRREARRARARGGCSRGSGGRRRAGQAVVHAGAEHLGRRSSLLEMAVAPADARLQRRRIARRREHRAVVVAFEQQRVAAAQVARACAP